MAHVLAVATAHTTQGYWNGQFAIDARVLLQRILVFRRTADIGDCSLQAAHDGPIAGRNLGFVDLQKMSVVADSPSEYAKGVAG